MNKCQVYMDYLEKYGLDEDSKEWTDVYSHALRCPDCSIDIKDRKILMEAMAEMPSVETPAGLHNYIMQNLENENAGDVEEISIFDNLFDKFARPLQVSISLACVFMIFSLMHLPAKHSPVAASRIEIAKKEPALLQVASEMTNSEKLEDVSQEEIKNFLNKLEKFRKSHPEAEKRLPIPATPELRLVIDQN